MNMCTIQSIKDAIRENCQSQYDMESTDIDQVLPDSPVFRARAVQSAEAQETLPAPKNRRNRLSATIFCEKDCGVFFMWSFREE